MKSRHLPLREAAISLAILTLAACGGDGSSSGSGPPHTIGGTISGLKGSGLALRDNGGGTLDISGNGNFTFPAAVAAGNPFAPSSGIGAPVTITLSP
jgi:hypothetical protein